MGKTLLWWIEPVAHARRTARSRLVDALVCFGVSAIVGLGIVAQSGSMMDVQLGSGTSLSVPAHAWQYGLWLLLCFLGGCGGWWIVSLAGRAEVNLRDDGILVQRRWSASFYAYPQIDGCEIVQAGNGAYSLLRIRTKPANGPAMVRELGISKRVDPKRMRDILAAAGVAMHGWNAD